jgi:hypothetical protein
MKMSRTALFWRLFAFSALWIAVINGLLVLLDFVSLAFALRMGVLPGIGGSLFFAGVTLWLHLRGLRLRGFDPDRDGLAVAAEREVRLHAPPQQTLTLCEQAVQQLPRARIQLVDLESGLIRARTGISWESFGECITCQVAPAEDGGSRVRVTSSPAIRITLVDYGKNWENAEHVGSILAGHTLSASELHRHT